MLYFKYASLLAFKIGLLLVFAKPLKSKLKRKVEKVAVRWDKVLKFFKLYFSPAFIVSVVPITTLAFDAFEIKSKQTKKLVSNMVFNIRIITAKVIICGWF